jgi:predicted  nucleic acid-binding Zn-ribbon protein
MEILKGAVMSKIPKPLVKQIENFNEIMEALNGLIDGSKIKLENYDDDFLEILTDIRKKGLELRDQIEVFKNKLEESVASEYDTTSNSRFASAKNVIDSFLTSKADYRF